MILDLDLDEPMNKERKGKWLPVVLLYPGAEGGGCDEAGGECTIRL